MCYNFDHAWPFSYMYIHIIVFLCKLFELDERFFNFFNVSTAPPTSASPPSSIGMYVHVIHTMRMTCVHNYVYSIMHTFTHAHKAKKINNRWPFSVHFSKMADQTQ